MIGHTDPSRRTFLKASVGIAGSGLIAGCLGGDSNGGDAGGEYPVDDVRLIVPTVPGGGTDAYGRLVANAMGDRLGVEVVVENISGAGMSVGTAAAYSADPDGYTIVTAEAGNLINAEIGFDAEHEVREMSHIGAVVQEPVACVMMDDAGIETWDDYVDNVEELNWGTAGKGSNMHLHPIILGEITGAYPTDELNFVHFDGTGEVLAGLERGEANAMWTGPLTSAALVTQSIEGANLFFVFADDDDFGWYTDEVLPDHDITYWTPDLVDLGVENVDWFSEATLFTRFFSGPPGVPQEVLEIHRETFLDLIDDDAFRESAAEAGRPVLNPGGHERVETAIEHAWEILGEEPVRGIIEDALGN